jgi:hypothetical protein
MPPVESREITGIRTFMLAVFAERPSLMMQTETGKSKEGFVCNARPGEILGHNFCTL